MLISQGYPYTARSFPKTNAAITRGQIVTLDKTSFLWRTAIATDQKPFGIALKDAAATDTFVLDVLLNAPFEATVTAGGAINPGTFVKAGAAGVAVQWVQGTDADELRVGEYIGTEQKMDGVNAPVASVNGDIICVRRNE